MARVESGALVNVHGGTRENVTDGAVVGGQAIAAARRRTERAVVQTSQVDRTGRFDSAQIHRRSEQNIHRKA